MSEMTDQELERLAIELQDHDPAYADLLFAKRKKELEHEQSIESDME